MAPLVSSNGHQAAISGGGGSMHERVDVAVAVGVGVAVAWRSVSAYGVGVGGVRAEVVILGLAELIAVGRAAAVGGQSRLVSLKVMRHQRHWSGWGFAGMKEGVVKVWLPGPDRLITWFCTAHSLADPPGQGSTSPHAPLRL